MLEWYVLIVRKNQIDKYNVLAGYEDELRKARRKKKLLIGKALNCGYSKSLDVGSGAGLNMKYWSEIAG